MFQFFSKLMNISQKKFFFSFYLLLQIYKIKGIKLEENNLDDNLTTIM